MVEGPFRIYGVDDAGAARHIASCDADSLGFTLLTLQGESQLDSLRVGIMHRPNPEASGDWLVNPYGARLETKDETRYYVENAGL